MPLHWTIDAERHLVTILATGDVTRPEFEDLDDALCAANAHRYRKFFHGVPGQMHMTQSDVLMLGARVRAHHAEGPMGPLAVLVSESDEKLLTPCWACSPLPTDRYLSSTAMAT